MLRRTPALALALLVAACQGAGTTPSGSAASSPSPRTTAASSPSARPVPTSTPGPSFRPLAPGPDVTLTVVGDGPVITRADGPPAHAAVMPGTTAVGADGMILAFLVWFGDAPGSQVVAVARSLDGRSWEVGHDPLYTTLDLGFDAPGPVPAAALQEADGRWTLFGWGAVAARRTSFFSWRATAPAVDGPWSVAPGEDRVLGPGERGTWDDETTAIGAVVRDGDGLAAWYEGQRAGRVIRGGIGYATSPDGVTWSRDPEPVVAPGQCGPGTGLAALEPQVWRREGGYLMLFAGYAEVSARGSVFAATSPDGRTWSCTGEVLLGATDIPGSEGIHTIQGVTVGGQPALLVESLRDRGSELWLVSVTEPG